MKPEIYQYLEENEIIEEGDEYENPSGKWHLSYSAGHAVCSALNYRTYRRKVKEKQMKYETLKPVSVQSVTVVCQTAAEKLAFWILGNGYSTCVRFDTILVETTIKAMPDNFRKWLVEHGFIRLVKEFEPFDIRVETAEECMELGRYSWKHNRKLAKIWEQIKPHAHFIQVEGEDEPD